MTNTVSSEPPIVRTIAELRETVRNWRMAGHKIAFVPTMGALHEGHLSLIELADQSASRVIVSIFVNPTQFAPHEDFDHYPRDLFDDVNKLSSTKTHLVYAPSTGDMYDPDFSTSLSTGSIAEGLCSTTRPHFFGGVSIVVAKLLLQCLPDIAVFGEKDYQQLLVIRRMVRDLNIPVEILGSQTCRESDGLAISSRNAYLTDKERHIAPSLYQTLQEVATKIVEDNDASNAIIDGIVALKKAGFDSVDYLELRDAATLEPVDSLDNPSRLLAAVFIGKTRLIDNLPVDPRQTD